MISVLILTYNEQINLPRCLAALEWADDVIVLDSYSSDNTVEIAQDHGARVIRRQYDNFANQRNYGTANGGVRHDWILHLDADEVVTPALRDEMQEVIQDGRFDAFHVASKLIFQDKWLKHAGMYPTFQVRLGRKDILTFRQSGHGQREDDNVTRVGILLEPLLHYSFAKGIEDWFSKHNRYSTDEAMQVLRDTVDHDLDWTGLISITNATRRRRALKQLSSSAPFRPTLRFLYTYLVRMGFLDGKAGFTYCRMLAIYQYLIDLKVREIQQARNTETYVGRRIK